MADIEYLEEERKKLWECVTALSQQVAQLQDDVHKTTPEYAQEAKSASKKISEYKNKASNAWQEIEKIKGDIQGLIKESQVILDAKVTASTINHSLTEAQTALTKSQETQATLNAALQELTNKANQIETTQSEVAGQLSTAEGNSKRISSLLEAAAKTQDNINNIYEEIDGYNTPEGNHVEGLRDKLQNSFEKIEKENQNLKKDLENTKNNISQWKTTFIKDKEAEFNTLSEKIKGLLPGAMSAGLSSAYLEKKTAEIVERNSAQNAFQWTIFWMSLIALLPIGYYFYLYYTNQTMEYIINHIPQVTLAVLPLYAPAIWLASHLNRRINLSKKLIEEYAYKEALNKTYEGLASQIKDLKDKDNELRKEHLQIILKASAENPGKFITGYDKCDNPILELLAKPEKLKDLLENNPILTTFIEQIINKSQTISKEKEANDK